MMLSRRKVPTLKLDQLRQLTDWIEFENGSWRHIELPGIFLQNGREYLFTVNYTGTISFRCRITGVKGSGLGGFDYYPAMPWASGARGCFDGSQLWP